VIPRILDLEHDGLPGAIGACLFLDPEPVLVDPGPSTTLDALEAGMRDAGVDPARLRHLCLTHVHLDHAGAAGHLAQRYPRLTVHVHVDGAPHVADPERLVASTRRTFGEAHDRLWGEVLAVPADRIRVWRPGGRGPLPWLRAIPTPGHIDHHLAYLDETAGILAAGDALGILLDPESPVHPPTPPPAVDLDAWLRTLGEIEAVGPERAAVAHFGLHAEPLRRTGELRDTLVALALRVREALVRGDADADAERFEAEVRETQARAVPRERVDRYFGTFAAATDYAGMRRWVERHPEWRDPRPPEWEDA
jgi:glyoxylase-like metal-dependent hydrolase (beta-lactamase superfamily II)